jgi:hypothetical protein
MGTGEGSQGLLKSEINENNILTSGKTHVTSKKLW